ncbi:MAG: SDR family oxidoreductase [Gemmatimonadetes bacterium]|nr:SDR family oxidoreductase [Gemmatimonadota bacterium]
MTEGQREVVVVTGASAGVGRATVRLFAGEGARIALLARDPARLEAAAAEVRELGGEALVLPTDVADADGVEEAAAQTEERFGPIDIWINNAMTSVFARTWDVRAEEFRRVTEVTYLGFVHGTLSALRRMRPRDRGRIIQVGSALAFRGIPLQAAYCASKHAIQGFTESLRCELLEDRSGVSVCSVHMPALNTPQFEWVRSRLPNRAQPVPPIFQPEVAAEAIHWAAHNQRTTVYVGMPTVKTVLGERIAPWFLDHYLARNGFDAQQTDEPADADRPDNLFDPVPGEFAAHGRFDHRARDSSGQLWATRNRRWLALAGGAAAVAAGFMAARDR